MWCNFLPQTSLLKWLTMSLLSKGRILLISILRINIQSKLKFHLTILFKTCSMTNYPKILRIWLRLCNPSSRNWSYQLSNKTQKLWLKRLSNLHLQKCIKTIQSTLFVIWPWLRTCKLFKNKQRTNLKN